MITQDSAVVAIYKSMNQATSSRIGLVLCGSLLACTTYAQPSVSIGVATHAFVAPAPNNRKARTEKQRPVPVVPELKPATNHPPAIKAATEQKAAQNTKMQEKPLKPADKKAQPPPKGKPDAVQKNGADPADKDHEKKERTLYGQTNTSNQQ